MLGPLDGLDVIDLTDKSFEEHAREVEATHGIAYGASLHRGRAMPTQWRDTPHHV